MNNKSKLDEWIGNAALLGWRIKNFKNAVIHSLGIMNGNIYDGIIKIVKRLFEVVKFVANYEPYGLKEMQESRCLPNNLF